MADVDFNSTGDGLLSEGENTDENSENESTNSDSTADNVAQNDPEKNKKLAEVTMSEQLRETYQLTVKIPRMFKKINTNQFFFMELSDSFYEKNYPDIISVIADKKYGRFAGFEKGRFFIDKIVEKGGIDGWYTELTLNPIPPSLAVYSKMQQEATKALIQAINQENWGSGGGGGGLVTTKGSDCGEDISTWAPHELSDSAFEKGASTIIGNSSANYATETANMTAEQAIKSINHHYVGYSNNKTCPAELWKNYPNIGANCADFARLVKCICDVHGQKCTIHHGPGHYWNYVYINNKWESVDLCSNYNNTHFTGGVLRNTAGWQ